MTMNAVNRIQAALAAPITHIVVTTFADGATRTHETRSEVAAENWATGERRKIGRELVSRNPDMTAGPVVRIVAVDVVTL